MIFFALLKLCTFLISSENTKIHALLDRDRDKLSRNAKIFRSWQILDLDRDFLVWTLMSRLNREISISAEISWSSRLTFENRRDYPSCQDWYFLASRQMETPKLKFQSNDPLSILTSGWFISTKLNQDKNIFLRIFWGYRYSKVCWFQKAGLPHL